MKLDEFFSALDQYEGCVPLPELCALQRKLEITPEDVRDVMHFDDECYQRNPLRTGAAYEALILCWKDGQASPIHDHRGSSCGVLVLEGECTELIFTRDEDGMLAERQTNQLPHRCVCGSYDTDIHEIANRQGDGTNLVTLHIYSPPLTSFGVYCRDSAQVTEAISTVRDPLTA